MHSLQLSICLARTVSRLIAIGDDDRAGLVVQIGRVRVVLVAGRQRFNLVKH